jgi:AcrR family transcriptional regulator
MSLSRHSVSESDTSCRIIAAVPRLWNATIEEHRGAVREAVLDTTAALVSERGLRAVTMSEIAERSGIGRATLYKYFPDVDAILLAWHERQVAAHLHQLSEVADGAGDAGARLRAVLEAFALITHERHDPDLSALLHAGAHVSRAHERLHRFVAELIAEGAEAGQLRGDVAPNELATYCLHALTAAGSLRSKAAVRRLVGVIVGGLDTRA